MVRTSTVAVASVAIAGGGIALAYILTRKPAEEKK